MIGARAVAAEDFSGEGQIKVHGERWAARCPVPVRRGQHLRVTGIDGLVLDVEPSEETEN
jgi:membrane-bound serine protease (ClpP class)